jgi:hypothetical protein
VTKSPKVGPRLLFFISLILPFNSRTGVDNTRQKKLTSLIAVQVRDAVVAGVGAVGAVVAEVEVRPLVLVNDVEVGGASCPAPSSSPHPLLSREVNARLILCPLRGRACTYTTGFNLVFLRAWYQVSGNQCWGFGSLSSRYGSGSGSFYHQAKIVRKTLIPTVL